MRIWHEFGRKILSVKFSLLVTRHSQAAEDSCTTPYQSIPAPLFRKFLHRLKSHVNMLCSLLQAFRYTRFTKRQAIAFQGSIIARPLSLRHVDYQEVGTLTHCHTTNFSLQ